MRNTLDNIEVSLRKTKKPLEKLLHALLYVGLICIMLWPIIGAFYTPIFVGVLISEKPDYAPEFVKKYPAICILSVTIYSVVNMCLTLKFAI